MNNEQDLGGAARGPIVSACEDRQTREVVSVEGPCPLCGKTQEYFSDELRTKEKLRCADCKQYFDVSLFHQGWAQDPPDANYNSIEL